jgi:hypothetical protein
MQDCTFRNTEYCQGENWIQLVGDKHAFLHFLDLDTNFDCGFPPFT